MTFALKISFAQGNDSYGGRGILNFPDEYVTGDRDPQNGAQYNVRIAAGAGGTLQAAYNNGEVIVTTAADGALELHRGATAAVGDGALLVRDAFLAPGSRTTPLVLISDDVDVAAGVATLEVRKSNQTNGPPNVLLRGEDVGPAGPILSLFHDSSTPAANDESGVVLFEANSSNGTRRTMVQVTAVELTTTNAAEFGSLDVSIMTGGTLGRCLSLAGFAAGAQTGFFAQNSAPVGQTPWFLKATVNFGAGQGVLLLQDGGGTLLQVDGDGDCVITQDVEAAGGYRFDFGPYTHALAANQTDVVLTFGLSNHAVAIHPGSQTGFGAELDAAVTAGTLTFNVQVSTGGGAFATVQTLVFTNVDGKTKVTTQAKDVKPLVATDLIRVVYTTDIAFAGAVAVTAYVEVEE